MKEQSVVVIGNFDGMHLGHQAVMAQAKHMAARSGYRFIVLTFTPHPRQVFQPNIAPFRLTPDSLKKEKICVLASPDEYVSLTFDEGLQHMSAEAFITDILVKQLNAATVVVGQDFHFGYQRSGTIETLQACPDFQTIAADLLVIGGDPVTSTRIRDHLKQAEINQANALLGWDWFIRSEVVHGDKRGRELGFPTANMHFGETIVPAHGVYAVYVRKAGNSSGEWMKGAANIGIRPMFETAMPMIETYIFDFSGDLYGQELDIRPVQKLRDEMKFNDLKTLTAQIKADCAAAREIL